MLLHPFMLAWIAGATVPLVLHLLSRSQYRAVPWGAMMFLTSGNAGPQYAARFKQWILLLLRMCVVGLLAVALSRPVISSRYAAVPTAGLTTAGPAAVVIIVDDSGSMAYQQNGKSRLDQAREVTLQILTALKHGDEAALLLAGSREYQPLIPPSGDLQSIAGRIADLQPDTGEADLAADLLRAADLLDHAAPADHEIYLICDRQALNWRNINDTFKQQWLVRKNSGAQPRLTVIPVGGDEADNVAIESVEFADRAALRDQPNNVQVRIHNYGGDPATTVPLSVWSGARTFAETSATIPPHSTAVVNITARFAETGSRIVSAALKSSGLTSDDRVDSSVDVLDAPQILVVTREKESATTHPLAQINSMITQAPGRRGIDPALVSAVAAQDLNPDLLKKCNVVIFDDVAAVSDEVIKSLRTFLSSGGGVLLLPGKTATADDYNKSFCRSTGLLPATLLPPVSKPAYLATFDRQHLLFHFMQSKPDALMKFPVTRIFPAAPANAGTHILARTNLNNPLLLETASGDGRVLMFTSNDSPAIAVLMPSLIRYLGTRTAVDRNLWPGQPIIDNTSEPIEDRSATVQFVSAGPREPAVVTHYPDHSEIHFSKTNRPGVYRLRYRTAGKEKLLSYVVNTPHTDSDLTPLSEDQWKALSRRLSFDRLDLSQTTVAAALDLQRDGREIWIDLLGAVLLLMATETLLSRWWSH